MFKFNENTPKNIKFNGLTVAKLVFNGITVWLNKVAAYIFGTTPLTLEHSTGEDLIDYKVHGDSVQNGTPAPDNPVEVESVGEKTNNLLLIDRDVDGVYLNDVTVSYLGDGKYSFKSTGSTTGNFIRFDIAPIMIYPDVTYYLHYRNKYGEENTNYSRHIAFKQKGVDGDSGILEFSTKGAKGEDMIVSGVSKKTEPHMVNQVTMWFSANYTYDFTIQPSLELTGDVTEYEHGGYKVPIVINDVETDIYLDEPLRKIREYADYIDFENQKVVRNIFEYMFTGSEYWVEPQAALTNTIRSYTSINAVPRVVSSMTFRAYSEKGVFDGASTSAGGGDKERCQFANGTNRASFYARILKSRCADPEAPVADDWRNIYSAGTRIYGVRETVVEEAIELPTIATEEGTNTVDVNTTLKPSNVEITYYKQGGEDSES